MDIIDAKSPKSNSEHQNNDVASTTYKRSIFGRQKTLSETSIYNPIDSENQNKSRKFSLADKTLDCITQCFWQCSSCYQRNEKY